MAKRLELIIRADCKECPYCMFDGGQLPRCKKMDNQPLTMKPNPNGRGFSVHFPSWCPLPEVEEAAG